MGLTDSRWASSGPTLRSWPQGSPTSPRSQQRQPQKSTLASARQGHNQTPLTSPENELARYLKLVARLKWKLPFLAEGYRVATDRAGRHPNDVAANEIHFKIDFYEYYMHIERALVHLMGVFGISVDGLAGSIHNSSNELSKSRPQGGAATAPHRYHANVLRALEDPQNPLFDVLGTGEVMRQLSRAKDLRNRWKNGDESGENRGYAQAPLEAYNLEQILAGIFQGFEEGYLLAQAYLQHDRMSDESSSGTSSPLDWDREEQDYGFMTDAMDWESI